MKVIILKTGEAKDVAEGYARNYLFPKKLAILANANALKQAEEKRKRLQLLETEEKKKEQTTIDKIKDIVVKISVKANEDGKMFAALSVKDVQESLLKQYQVELPEFWIHLPENPIKEVGEYTLEVVSKYGAKTKLKIQVNK